MRSIQGQLQYEEAKGDRRKNRENQEPAVVPAPVKPTVQERWSFKPPGSWQPQPQKKPLTRSVSARRNQEKIKLHSKTRGKGTGSMNREEGRQ